MIKFTNEQKQALWESAWHWLENWQAAVDGRLDDINIWAEECPCCAKWYLYEFKHPLCYGCPIRQYTGVPNCGRTPWEEARLEWFFLSEHAPNTDYISHACEREYRFLVSLALEEDPVYNGGIMR